MEFTKARDSLDARTRIRGILSASKVQHPVQQMSATKSRRISWGNVNTRNFNEQENQYWQGSPFSIKSNSLESEKFKLNNASQDYANSKPNTTAEYILDDTNLLDISFLSQDLQIKQANPFQPITTLELQAQKQDESDQMQFQQKIHIHLSKKNFNLRKLIFKQDQSKNIFEKDSNKQNEPGFKENRKVVSFNNEGHYNQANIEKISNIKIGILKNHNDRNSEFEQDIPSRDQIKGKIEIKESTPQINSVEQDEDSECFKKNQRKLIFSDFFNQSSDDQANQNKQPFIQPEIFIKIKDQSSTNIPQSSINSLISNQRSSINIKLASGDLENFEKMLLRQTQDDQPQQIIIKEPNPLEKIQEIINIQNELPLKQQAPSVQKIEIKNGKIIPDQNFFSSIQSQGIDQEKQSVIKQELVQTISNAPPQTNKSEIFTEEKEQMQPKVGDFIKRRSQKRSTQSQRNMNCSYLITRMTQTDFQKIINELNDFNAFQSDQQIEEVEQDKEPHVETQLVLQENELNSKTKENQKIIHVLNSNSQYHEIYKPFSSGQQLVTPIQTVLSAEKQYVQKEKKDQESRIPTFDEILGSFNVEEETRLIEESRQQLKQKIRFELDLLKQNISKKKNQNQLQQITTETEQIDREIKSLTQLKAEQSQIEKNNPQTDNESVLYQNILQSLQDFCGYKCFSVQNISNDKQEVYVMKNQICNSFIVNLYLRKFMDHFKLERIEVNSTAPSYENPLFQANPLNRMEVFKNIIIQSAQSQFSKVEFSNEYKFGEVLKFMVIQIKTLQNLKKVINSIIETEIIQKVEISDQVIDVYIKLKIFPIKIMRISCNLLVKLTDEVAIELLPGTCNDELFAALDFSKEKESSLNRKINTEFNQFLSMKDIKKLNYFLEKINQIKMF